MKVRSLTATGVHGYLSLNVEFEPELTFLTGLNGCGKTTALRLLMALLKPNLDELTSIAFNTAVVKIDDESGELDIAASRNDAGIELTTSRTSHQLHLSTTDIQLLWEAQRRDEQRTPLHERLASHPVHRAILEISTPMYLGLDRRHFPTTWDADQRLDIRRREALMHRLRAEDWSSRGNYSQSPSLMDVCLLVSDTMQQVRAAQEQLDNTLRKQILSGAFRYKPMGANWELQTPPRKELDAYRAKQAKLEEAGERLSVPLTDIRQSLDDFFVRMNKIVDALESSNSDNRRSGKRSRKQSAASAELLEWFVNKPQADRIFDQLQLLDKYGTERSGIRSPIDTFLLLVNGFLQQTGKRLQVTDRGELVVEPHSASSEPRPITALSSGERQVVVMLGHLKLNPSLARSGVFIVDEPELSLHVSWQERFVDAVREANPNVQYILATHSPAIILDRTEYCRELAIGAQR